MTTRKTQKKRNYKSKGLDFTNYFVILGISAFLFILYIFYRMYISERHLVSIALLALFSGVIFEAKHIIKNWPTILSIVTISVLLSLFAFIPSKKENHYDFEMRIQIWPYCFLFFFLILTIVMMKDKIIPKLTEGITLLQSLAIFYWIWDFNYLRNHFLLLFFIIGFVAPFGAFSVFHAFSKRELTKKSRLILSIWSTFIFLLFSIENIIRTFQNQQIENTGNLFEGIYIGLQYFLLGVSSVYIVQNYCMLIAFLPSKGSFFNKKYYAEIKEAKADHVNRFSIEQIKISNALFCLIFASTLFYLNHFYKVVPKHIAIWLVFVTFPILLNFYESLKRQN